MLSLKKCLTLPIDYNWGERHDTLDGPYFFRDNGSKVLGVAHLDVVLKAKPIRDCGCVYAPQLDDRLGVWCLLDALPDIGINLDILLTTGEESARSTAQYFSGDYNWIVEFDRAGMDVVFYDYDEKPWRRAWRKYFKEGCGSFSDISLMEDMGVCAANIGIGYYHQHTINCYAYIADTRKQLEKFSRFYQENKDIKYPHSNWCERNHRKKQANWNVRYKQDNADYTAKHYGDDYAAYRNQYQYLDNDGFWRDKEGFFDAWEEYRAEECV